MSDRARAWSDRVRARSDGAKDRSDRARDRSDGARVRSDRVRDRSDREYGPCPPTRDWGSHVSGLVFLYLGSFNWFGSSQKMVTGTPCP